MQAALDLRMLRKQVPGPVEGRRRRFMPGQQQGQHFVTQLLITHAHACLLVLRREQHPKQVFCVRVYRLPSSLIDDGVDDGVEGVQPCQQTAVAWSGNPQWWEGKRGVPGDQGTESGESASDYVRFIAEIEREEGQSDN